MNTKIFLDSGDPAETRYAVERLGFLDGQTTNPSLVAKNPQIQELKNSGQLNETVIWEQYKNVALHIRDVIPNGAISVEVYADAATDYETMLAKGRELASWFPGIYVKLPTTHVGLQVAHTLVAEGVNVNMTLCFSQDQAAAVHMATVGAKRGQVFVSPFIGRLDDMGLHGVHLIKNIRMMYDQWSSHVKILAASIRGLEHLFSAIQSGADILTIPISVVDLWTTYGIDKNVGDYPLEISDKQPILYKDLTPQDWVLYDIHHDLTDKGIEKFASDWKGLFS